MELKTSAKMSVPHLMLHVHDRGHQQKRPPSVGVKEKKIDSVPKLSGHLHTCRPPFAPPMRQTCMPPTTPPRPVNLPALWHQYYSITR
ncbi:hypothetical protein Mapa_008901 [Marchantia paleacea]|nr:hypothetical protein Mapa_008901 [Marchantia paleacea]